MSQPAKWEAEVPNLPGKPNAETRGICYFVAASQNRRKPFTGWSQVDDAGLSSSGVLFEKNDAAEFGRI